jgi:RND family efflux transporter MFP subunit
MTTDTVVLKSPAPGAVLKINGVIGSTASPLPSEPLFQIAVDGEIELEAEVPSIYVPKLSVGQTARVRLPDMSELSGKVRLVPAAIDQKTQLGRARITLEHDPALRYGTFVSATINADRSCGVSVPNSAVTYRTGGASVQVVNSDIIETRNIEIGIRSDSDIEVRKGLSEGDLVVANAGTSLRDGDRVKPIAAETTRDGRL